MTPETAVVLQVIDRWVQAHGMGPTMQEIASQIGVSSHTTAQHHVQKLLASGLLTCERTGPARHVASRTLRLTAAGHSWLARRRRLSASPLLVGERELALDAQAVRAARRAGMPLDAFRTRVEADRIVIRLADRADRDFWAELILDELQGNDE